MITKFKDWPDIKSPFERLSSSVYDRAGINVFVKRDDLLAPIPGNKARKLKYHYQKFVEGDYDRIITFGGPFSNHIYAAATFAREFKIPVTGLIRGSVTDRKNPVLEHARACGMQLVGVDRKTYSQRYDPEGEVFSGFLAEGRPMIIPEGGSGPEGIYGCGELVDEVLEQLGRRPAYWVVAAGTGGTAGGISQKLTDKEVVFAIAALQGRLMAPSIENLTDWIQDESFRRIRWDYDHHLGGLAKYDNRLIGFMRQFEQHNGFMLDPLYTGKAFLAMTEMIKAGIFIPGCDVVFVHTGGMPGRVAFEYRFGDILTRGEG